jgi:hypothetical protein
MISDKFWQFQLDHTRLPLDDRKLREGKSNVQVIRCETCIGSDEIELTLKELSTVRMSTFYLRENIASDSDVFDNIVANINEILDDKLDPDCLYLSELEGKIFTVDVVDMSGDTQAIIGSSPYKKGTYASRRKRVKRE